MALSSTFIAKLLYVRKGIKYYLLTSMWVRGGVGPVDAGESADETPATGRYFRINCKNVYLFLTYDAIRGVL